MKKNKRDATVVAGAVVDDLVVEGRQDLLGVHADRDQQRGSRNLAGTVDGGVHDVIVHEVEVYALTATLESSVRTSAVGRVHHQELVIGCLLNLEQVRHLCNFRNLSEELA